MTRRPRSARPGGSKIVPASALGPLGKRLRRSGRCVVFTNGCFDLVHPGHLALLEAARALGDALVVGVNSDGSVRRLKGPGRPLVPQKDRARMLAALECVDHVTIFSGSTPLRTILRLRPDVLVKGADWRRDDIVGRAEVEGWGGRVARVALKGSYSTTRLLGRLSGKAVR